MRWNQFLFADGWCLLTGLIPFLASMKWMPGHPLFRRGDQSCSRAEKFMAESAMKLCASRGYFDHGGRSMVCVVAAEHISKCMSFQHGSCWHTLLTDKQKPGAWTAPSAPMRQKKSTERNVECSRPGQGAKTESIYLFQDSTVRNFWQVLFL